MTFLGDISLFGDGFDLRDDPHASRAILRSVLHLQLEGNMGLPIHHQGGILFVTSCCCGTSSGTSSCT